MRSFWPATLLVLALTGAASAAEQASNAAQTVADCNRLADVVFEDLDAGKAISTCLSAIRIAPDDNRLHGQLGRGYLKAGEDEAALKSMRLGAERGDFRAMSLLGYMYKVGRGVPNDDREAVRLFRKAADGGEAGGMNQLGLMYKLGRGVSRDYDQAVRLFRKADGKGSPGAAISLGLMYRSGLGVARDDREAARLFRKAAASGKTAAMAMLGDLYLQGRGVRKDHAEALRWIRKAVARGDAGAMGVLGAMYLQGRIVRQDSGEAVRLFRRSADKERRARCTSWERCTRRAAVSARTPGLPRSMCCGRSRAGTGTASGNWRQTRSSGARRSISNCSVC